MPASQYDTSGVWIATGEDNGITAEVPPKPRRPVPTHVLVTSHARVVTLDREAR